MKQLVNIILIIVLTCLLESCASYKTQYSNASQNWLQDTIAGHPLHTHTMYLLGDAGNDLPGNPAPVLQYLKTQLIKEPANSSIVFMGDNIYEYGMPDKEDSVKRLKAEHRILSQLQVLDNFKGRPVFLPGNHDWRGWGLKGLNRQEKFIEKYLNQQRGRTDKDDWENYFLPDNGCSGAEVVELGNDVVLIVVDSEWWLRDWDKEPQMNVGCEVKNRQAFIFQFENIVRKYRNKQVVIAMHHPLLTYGSHGGSFTARSHFFPLTDIKKNWYLPLPVIGTLGVAYRSAIGSRQDVANRHYRELKAAIMAAVKKNGSFILAAGHEHALQMIEEEAQHIIVSGAGSKTTPVTLGKGSAFASGRPGYSTILFYDNGEMLVRFWEVDKSGSNASIIFQKKIEKPKLAYDVMDSSFALYEKHPDSITATLTVEKVKPAGGLENVTLGKHYRDLYMQQYSFPVMDLATFKGGLKPEKLGGGNQTNSLRLNDTLGRDYVFRGIDKDVTRLLPFPFNRMTAAKYLIKNNFLSTHPFAPIAIVPLADAINVYHTNPALYYIPAQPALGDYNAAFGNVMALVEERPAGKKWQHASWFGNPKKIIGTPDLLENLQEDNKYKVDQSWVLRTRFLDWLIGDWDRHDDQWTWAAIELSDGQKVYRPIPRDRDQAFSKYDGLATGIARFTMPFLRQLQVYGPTIANKKWNTWSARLFDRSFLNELDWPQWEEQVKFVQAHLTDSVIENAFNQWPLTARDLTASHIIQSLKARRDQLGDIAKAHYDFINRSVTVVGTDEKERFIIERLDDEHTLVSVFELSKNGALKKENYRRVFDNKITKSINLYGHGSADEFIVKGNVNKGIKLRLIGGQGKDVFVDSSEVKNGAKKTLVYDDLRKNTVIGGSETKDKRTTRYQYNIYDRRDYGSEYDIIIPLPGIGINPDDGLLLSASFDMTRYGFKKEPFKSRQVFGASYAFGTRSFSLHYTGDFISSFGNLDFYAAARYHGPTYAFNYAGIGNGTKRPIDDPDYYRVRQSEIFLYPALKKRFGINGFAALGPFLQITEIEPTRNRFITDSAGANKADLFGKKYYSGARLLFDFNSVDNLMAPHAGIKYTLEYNYYEQLKKSNSFSTVRTSLSFYKALDHKENFILASQLGAGFNIGSGYEFFQMPSIGGDQGLRGYREQRYYGRSSFWHSTDLRIRFGTSYNEALPFTIGMFAGFDYGRVWDKNSKFNKWHYDYGGGIWFAPVDLLTLSVGAFVPGTAGEESPRIALKLGFSF